MSLRLDAKRHTRHEKKSEIWHAASDSIILHFFSRQRRQVMCIVFYWLFSYRWNHCDRSGFMAILLSCEFQLRLKSKRGDLYCLTVSIFFSWYLSIARLYARHPAHTFCLHRYLCYLWFLPLFSGYKALNTVTRPSRCFWMHKDATLTNYCAIVCANNLVFPSVNQHTKTDACIVQWSFSFIFSAITYRFKTTGSSWRCTSLYWRPKVTRE